MALSGSVNTSGYDGRHYQLSWTATQNVANNQSTVSWTLKAVGGDDSWYAERTLKVVLAGSTVYSKTDRVQRYKGTVASGTKVITHDANGNASFSVSIQAAVYYSAVNCTGSGSFTLNNIPRKSTLSVSNGVLGTAQTLTVTRKSTSFTHTITATCGSASATIATKSTASSFSFTPPLAWASQSTSSASVSVKYTITTYNGSTSIGSNSYTVSCSIPSSVKPTVSITVSCVGGLNEKYGCYIQGQSKVKVDIVAQGSQGSTIKSYKTVLDDKTYTTASVTSDVLRSYGTLAVTTTVTDSRGRTATTTENITVLKYSPPIITDLVIRRSDSTGASHPSGEYLAIDYSVQITPLNDINSARYYLWYKKTKDTDYTIERLTNLDGQYVLDNLTTVFSASPSSSYNVKIVAEDDFYSGENAISKVGTGSSALKVWSIFRQGLGMALGKVAEKTGLEVDWDAWFNKKVYINNIEVGTRLETLSTDYVVQQGTSGIWNYTKWASGKCEMFGYNNAKVAINNQQGTAIYRSAPISVTFPFTVYNMVATISCTDVNAWASINTYRSAEGNSALSYVYWRGGSYAEYTWYAYIHILGTWK